MAKRNNLPRFLLGVLDDQITEKHADEVDWSTSKIGGTANWIQPGVSVPSCRSCSQDQCLVVQIYCPLDGSPYHRTIYIFACINRNCWNNSDGWTAIRSQRLDEAGFIPVSVDVRRRTSSESWLENSDDWDEDNGNEDVYQDLYRGTDLVNNQGIGGWSSTSGIAPDTVRRETVDADGNNVINMVSDDDGQNQNVILPEDAAYRQSVEALHRLELNEAGVGAVEGAVGLDPALEASAEVESPDEGSITAETPVMPAPETLALLLAEPPPLPKEMKAVLKPWFLGVVDEPYSEVQPQLTEHERELVLAYQKSEGLNFNELYNRSRGNKIDIQGPGELYERSFPKHGDRAFHKLLSRLHLCPQQLLRYSRDPESFPIFLGPISAENVDPGRCSRCGEPRTFELQLLPSLIEYMRVEGVDGTVLEFGVVVLYTCRASCWDEGDLYCEESIVVQPDPDCSIFANLASRCLT